MCVPRQPESDIVPFISVFCVKIGKKMDIAVLKWGIYLSARRKRKFGLLKTLKEKAELKFLTVELRTVK